jgi:hypothetical protein
MPINPADPKALNSMKMAIRCIGNAYAQMEPVTPEEIALRNTLHKIGTMIAVEVDLWEQRIKEKAA